MIGERKNQLSLEQQINGSVVLNQFVNNYYMKLMTKLHGFQNGVRSVSYTHLDVYKRQGIRLDQLTDHVAYQSSLFEDFDEKKENETLDFVVDEIKQKFGDQVIGKASLVENKIRRKFD